MLLGAFGDPGHAFPMIALGAELARRGHHVTLQTWARWREPVEAEGMTFAAAPEYHVFPTRERPLKPYAAVVRAARETLPLVEAMRPEAVVADILTLAPALAGELAGLPVATLVPHVDPRTDPGWPVYSIGARLPRTRAGRAFWTAVDRRVVRGGLEQGRRELDETRARLGLPPSGRVHGGISTELALVATVPALEYPRSRPVPGAHVVGPMLWEPPGHAAVDPPAHPAGTPVVLVAPSTAQDREQRLLRAALAGLADEPVRVIAVSNRRGEALPDLAVPPNAVLVDWLSYARTMPACDVVVTHAGNGTLARALVSGCRVVCCPAGGDMAENAARVAWAGVGVRLPRRFVSPRSVRLAVRAALADEAMGARVRAAAAWAREHDGPARAADLVEELAARRTTAGAAGTGR